MKAKIAVLASGEGTNFEAIAKAAQAGRLEADIVGLLTNREKIGAIGRANRLEIPTKIIAPKDFKSRELWDQAMVDQLEKWQADWVVLAGFLALIGPKMLERFPHRIINSHPALLPKYGGPGMYGDNVHSAVLAAGDKESGITIHTIDADYDRGKILAQERVNVVAGDTVDRLSDRVKAAEVALYPRVLNDLVTGRITTS
ncbi:MAG: phosphoribosylglycinamide formyltransferase [Bdellovibrionales bacterium]